MDSALVVDAVLLGAVLEADLGGHRKIGRFRILRPLGIAVARSLQVPAVHKVHKAAHD